MPETPESTKGQISDGDTSRLESPKMVKPVLGKVQAKKRLMAFANKFNVLPKPQVKATLSQHSTGTLKTKDKVVQEDTNTNKSRKKPGNIIENISLSKVGSYYSFKLFTVKYLKLEIESKFGFLSK